MEYWEQTLLPHYLNTNAIKVVEPSEQNKFISRAFLIKKGSGGYRLVVDLRRVNKFFTPKKVKFESLANLRFCAVGVSTAISVDIADAYHHM